MLKLPPRRICPNPAAEIRTSAWSGPRTSPTLSDDLAAGDDQVIEDSDVDQLQRLLQALGDEAVGRGGLRDSARMLGCISRCHRRLFGSSSGPTVPQTASSSSLS